MVVTYLVQVICLCSLLCVVEGSQNFSSSPRRDSSSVFCLYEEKQKKKGGGEEEQVCTECWGCQSPSPLSCSAHCHVYRGNGLQGMTEHPHWGVSPPKCAITAVFPPLQFVDGFSFPSVYSSTSKQGCFQ